MVLAVLFREFQVFCLETERCVPINCEENEPEVDDQVHPISSCPSGSVFCLESETCITIHALEMCDGESDLSGLKSFEHFFKKFIQRAVDLVVFYSL